MTFRQMYKPAFDDLTPIQKVAYVTNNVDVDPERGCWLWRGSTHRNTGYAQVGSRTKTLHRRMRELLEGREANFLLQAHHRCEVPRCVNPFHIEFATVKRHIALHPERNRNTTQCRNGHPWVEEYRLYMADGTSRCKICWGRFSHSSSEAKELWRKFQCS
jgi:hypothetical protein